VVIVSFRGPAGRELHAPANPVKEQAKPGQRVIDRNWRRIASAILARVQHWSSSQLQTADPPSSAVSSSASWAGVSLHFAPPAPLVAGAWAAGLQRPPPAVPDIRNTLKPPSHLLVAVPGLDPLGRLQPHPLAAGLLRGSQPAAIRIPNNTDMRRSARRDQKPELQPLKVVRQRLQRASNRLVWAHGL
jgi:hypothetical protein